MNTIKNFDTIVNGKNLTWDELSLASSHQADLEKSGLSPDTVRLAGIHSVRPADIGRIVGSGLANKVDSLLCFSYNHGSDFCRYKLFPSVFIGRRKVKYFQPAGSESHVYIPPGTEKLSDPSETLYITEGEKKALRWSQEGFTCTIAIGGCWSWKDSSSLNPKLISDFSQIPLRGRKVIVIPDSDFQTNQKVRLGYLHFAIALLQEGAELWFSPIPPGAEEVRRGLDDYLQDRHTAEDVLSHLVRVDLNFLRKEEVNFLKLRFILDRLEDIQNGLSPEEEEHDGRITPLEIINFLWVQNDHSAHTCRLHISYTDLFRKGNIGWFAKFQQDTWTCAGCAWEKGREITKDLALNFPLGFFYILMPIKKDHSYLRRRILRKGGIGGKLISKHGDKKVILSSVSVDPSMEFLTWDNPLMIELFRKFLCHEPDWPNKAHKFDSFGEFEKMRQKKAKGATERGFQHFRIVGEPEEIKKSLELLGSEVSPTYDFKLSEVGEWFFDFITGLTTKVRPAPLPADNPLWRAKILRS